MKLRISTCSLSGKLFKSQSGNPRSRTRSPTLISASAPTGVGLPFWAETLARNMFGLTAQVMRCVRFRDVSCRPLIFRNTSTECLLTLGIVWAVSWDVVVAVGARSAGPKARLWIRPQGKKNWRYGRFRIWFRFWSPKTCGRTLLGNPGVRQTLLCRC